MSDSFEQQAINNMDSELPPNSYPWMKSWQLNISNKPTTDDVCLAQSTNTGGWSRLKIVGGSLKAVGKILNPPITFMSINASRLSKFRNRIASRKQINSDPDSGLSVCFLAPPHNSRV